MRKIIYLFALLPFASFTSCIKDSDLNKNYDKENDDAIAKYISKFNLNAESTPSGLNYVIEEQGDGEAVTKTSATRVSMKGYVLNGNVFQKLDDYGHSYDLNSILPGLQEGLSLFNVGGKGKLILPSRIAFGNIEYTNIPRGSVLVFDIVVNSAAKNFDDLNDIDISEYILSNNLETIKTKTGLHYIIEEEGDGEMPTYNSSVKVNYNGYFINGDEFDSSKVPIVFDLSSVIEGWREGFQYFKEGGKGKLIIPSRLGYGKNSYNGIPGGSVLIFDVELLEVK